MERDSNDSNIYFLEKVRLYFEPVFLLRDWLGRKLAKMRGWLWLRYVFRRVLLRWQEWRERRSIAQQRARRFAQRRKAYVERQAGTAGSRGGEKKGHATD